VNGICSCGLPAHCCQPAVAGGVIYADLRCELNTHLALQALFTQSSPVHQLLLQAFPFPSTLGEVTLHPHSPACMFVYSSHGKWDFPPLLWSFPPTTAFTSFPAPDSWRCCCSCQPACLFTAHVGSGSSPISCGLFLPPSLLQAFPLLVVGHVSLSSQAQLVNLQFQEGIPSPLFGAQGAPPSLQCVFIVLIAYYSVSLFSLGGGQSVQGAMLFWPRVVCGSIAYHLAHLVFPSDLGVASGGLGVLLVSLFKVKWRFSALAGGVEGSKFCLFLVVLPARCVSSVSPRYHYRRLAFCFPPPADILPLPF
jgi:hypothetical protein